MNKTKLLKGECQHCGGRLEFPAEMAGLTADCPHCGQATELLLARPPEEQIVPRRTVVWAIIGIVILGLGLAGAIVALKRAERWAARQKRQVEAAPPAESTANDQTQSSSKTEEADRQNGFVVSAVELEKATGTSLVYAVGTVKNASDRKRFGVKVELDLFDTAGQKIGAATDYQQVMETNTTWRFKALVVNDKVVSAKVASIKEDQ